MSENASSSSTTATLAGVGLFLITTALSQYMQQSFKRNNANTSSAREMEETFDEQDLRQLYQNRRLADRLSYEHLPQAMLQQQHYENARAAKENAIHAPEIPEKAPLTTRAKSAPEQGVTEWNLLQQQRKTTQQQTLMAKQVADSGFVPLTKKLSEMEVHPNAHYDFHPKNRNWRHFEHYNEWDRKRREAKLAKQNANAASERSSNAPVSTPSMTEKEKCDPTVLMPLKDAAEMTSGFQTRRSGSSDLSPRTTDNAGEETSDDDDDNDAASISSSSCSEEEQFVWTKHRHSSATANSNKAAQPSRPDEAQGASKEQRPSIAKSTTSEPPPATISFPSRPVQMVRRFLSLDASASEDTAATEQTKNTSELQSNGNPISHPSLEMYNRRLRAEYNARIMPEKLVLIRHGQSMGNINEVLYSTTPDNAMPLTDLGWEQARNAGKVLREKILASGESVHFIVSPYVRTVETFHGLVSAWCDPTSEEFASIENHDEKVKAWYHRLMEMGLTWNEDPRLREQDFGNYQDPERIKKAKEERWRFGAFYYRFPHGESASDVFDRVSTFLDSLWRSFEMNKSQNYVLVTHGIVLRVFLARYFRYTIDQFNTLANPKNCELVVLAPSGAGKLDLEGRCALDIEEDPETKQPHVTGYKFHKRLRILPKSAIR